MAAQYVIGIWEYHVNDLDADLIRDMNEYVPTLINYNVWDKAPQLRTIPVEKSIDGTMRIMAHEHVENLIKAQKKILVAPCICRREHKMVGEGCKAPEESCLVFGTGADYYYRNGLGRMIDHDEALAILKKADKAGLVLQPSNAKKVMNICCCCGCCCQILKNLKKHPKPASVVSSPFVAAVDSETCKACGVCIDRCQVNAVTMEEESVSLDRDRCIGCGLCVSTCPTKSMKLVRKPERQQKDVPKSVVETYMKIGRTRGKMNKITLGKTVLKSKFDRLMTSKK
jgi:Fe-S-cluster-containing hydrogenase component 2